MVYSCRRIVISIIGEHVVIHCLWTFYPPHRCLFASRLNRAESTGTIGVLLISKEKRKDEGKKDGGSQ